MFNMAIDRRTYLLLIAMFVATGAAAGTGSLDHSPGHDGCRGNRDDCGEQGYDVGDYGAGPYASSGS